MKELTDLKLSALDNIKENQDKKYDITNEELNNANNVIKRGMMSKNFMAKVEERCNSKDFNEVWAEFSKNEYADDFKAYMGYGIEEILKVGKEKFLKTVDWSIKHVKNYQWRKDAVKVIICGECKNEFTTFQMDFGLCDECKKKFDMERFYSSLEAMEKVNPGSSASEAMMFTFYEDYRECYRILNDSQIVDTVVDCDFIKPNAILLILEAIKQEKTNVIEDIKIELNDFINEDPEIRGIHKKLLEYIEEENIKAIVDRFIG